MLKNSGKKFVIHIVGTTATCLLMLLVAVGQRGIRVDGMQRERDLGMRSLQSLESSVETESRDSAQSGRRNGFSAYFSKLTRERREVEKPNPQMNPVTETPPAEHITPNDIFIAVKTTKKFHQSRLDLLLDTWISRNMQQVRREGAGFYIESNVLQPEVVYGKLPMTITRKQGKTV